MPRKRSFDYVIVGGGSAGCVLASRLSEDPACHVLLLEAGPRDSHPLIRIPLSAAKLREIPSINWSYRSEREQALNGRTMPLPRGKVLGGSSSINMMVYTRGDKCDFDRWEALGAKDWSYNNVLPYFRRAETWRGPKRDERGDHGPLQTQPAGFQDSLCDAWLIAAEELGYPIHEDPSCGDMEGFARAQYTIGQGRRSSTAAAYLRRAEDRQNLTVVTGALTSRVLLHGTRASGVEYVDDMGHVERAEARCEVILCAGTYNTPQLLMLSGIGPPTELLQFGIKPIVDLPVGQNLQEHLSVFNHFSRRTPGPLHDQLRFDRAAINMSRAFLARSGPATNIPLGVLGFIKTHASLAAPDIEFTLPAAAPDAALWFPGVRRAYADGFGVRTVLLHPKSRGSVSLRSADPRQSVAIRFNFLSDPNDMAVLCEGFRLGRELAHSEALREYRGAELSPVAGADTPARIEAHIRSTSQTLAHPGGTCAMGESQECVVDSQLRVRGMQGLRVADASVMPDLVSGHINACTIMIGERAADLIRAKQPTVEART